MQALLIINSLGNEIRKPLFNNLVDHDFLQTTFGLLSSDICQVFPLVQRLFFFCNLFISLTQLQVKCWFLGLHM